MRSVRIKVLKNRLSEYVRLAASGETVLVTDRDRLIFAFEARRSGDSGLARMFGGYRSDKAIQEEDIRDLAKDLADFILRNGGSR